MAVFRKRFCGRLRPFEVRNVAAEKILNTENTENTGKNKSFTTKARRARRHEEDKEQLTPNFFVS